MNNRELVSSILEKRTQLGDFATLQCQQRLGKTRHSLTRSRPSDICCYLVRFTFVKTDQTSPLLLKRPFFFAGLGTNAQYMLAWLIRLTKVVRSQATDPELSAWSMELSIFNQLMYSPENLVCKTSVIRRPNLQTYFHSLSQFESPI